MTFTPLPCRRLIVNGDDFGLSTQVNAGILHAHRSGILTSTSLMVTGPAWEDAVALAKATPSLSVGLHLTLVQGRAVLSPHLLPDLIDHEGNFSHNSTLAGLRYFFSRLRRSRLLAPAKIAPCRSWPDTKPFPSITVR